MDPKYVKTGTSCVISLQLVANSILLIYYCLTLGSFEISVNGQLLFSKLNTDGFPDNKEVIHTMFFNQKVV